MKREIINQLKPGFILFCVIYAVTTLFSSALLLYQGQPTDTNLHILNRGAVILIAVITIILFEKIKLKSKVLSYFVPYAISMGIVFLYVWISGFIEPLHPDAYRDIFLNFTSVTICVIIVITIKDRLKEKR
ncbi:DUF6608 family protein [Serpentinicella alkaliphila]|uniref:Uncharacterized protein n=1 Tax=Serpentinicella alkaliphila TaxID=1734049 RepID=A0A4R2SXZ7_9FIRM|nr:DUF6608 family protein [Serpentinicella alkaliphila]QUH26177.1 hypothetical protein HZR23_10845 [Serpentinicella alkaliphila]TCP93344.1 hypothetical protein EDD79_10818 [Serpentinicella alkaliphila]